MAQRAPGQLALARAAQQPGRELQPLAGELLDDRARGSGAREPLKQEGHGLLDCAVGVGDDAARQVVGQADWQRDLQLGAAGLGQDAALQAGADEVQLGLAHRALQAQQQTVVEVAGVIEAVLVAHQRARQRTDLKQPVPVHRVACQAADRQAEHDPGAAQATSATRRW